LASADAPSSPILYDTDVDVRHRRVHYQRISKRHMHAPSSVPIPLKRRSISITVLFSLSASARAAAPNYNLHRYPLPSDQHSESHAAQQWFWIARRVDIFVFDLLTVCLRNRKVLAMIILLMTIKEL
jgi:hypothetical protein